MPKKRAVLRKGDKAAIFWIAVMLLLFCTYKLYLYHTESLQTMAGQNEKAPQSLFGSFVHWAEE